MFACFPLSQTTIVSKRGHGPQSKSACPERAVRRWGVRATAGVGRGPARMEPGTGPQWRDPSGPESGILCKSFHATRLIEHNNELGRGAKPALFPLLIKSAAQHPINIPTMRPPWHASPWISERQHRRSFLSEAIGGLPSVRNSTSMADHPCFLTPEAERRTWIKA